MIGCEECRRRERFDAMLWSGVGGAVAVPLIVEAVGDPSPFRGLVVAGALVAGVLCAVLARVRMRTVSMSRPK